MTDDPLYLILQLYSAVMAEAVFHGSFVGFILVVFRGWTGLKKRRRVSGLDTLV